MKLYPNVYVVPEISSNQNHVILMFVTMEVDVLKVVGEYVVNVHVVLKGQDVNKQLDHFGEKVGTEQHFRTCAHCRTCPHVRMWGVQVWCGAESLKKASGAVRVRCRCRREKWMWVRCGIFFKNCEVRCGNKI